MTQQAYSTPPRSFSYVASGGGSDYGEQTSKEENIDQTSVPPGWQTFRDERNQQVFFNKSTGQMEYSLDDLFKKPRSSKEKRNPATSSTTATTSAGDYIYQSAPSSRTRSAPSRPSPDLHASCPDHAAQSSSVVTPSRDENSTSTTRRVPGVVDLVSSEGGEGTDSDEETVLDDSNLPRTEDFEFRQHRGSDGGRDDDESDCESEVLF
jgi:hypothetical protein